MISLAGELSVLLIRKGLRRESRGRPFCLKLCEHHQLAHVGLLLNIFLKKVGKFCLLASFNLNIWTEMLSEFFTDK